MVTLEKIFRTKLQPHHKALTEVENWRMKSLVEFDQMGKSGLEKSGLEKRERENINK